jgi:uncharacterized protein (DUF433 family)
MGGTNYLNLGIYTIPQAAALSSISTSRLRRWIDGYRTTKGTNQIPLIDRDFTKIDNHIALSFLELIDILFVREFLKRGVSIQTIRKTHDAARLLVNDRHPFSTRQFRTDGRDIFAQIVRESGDSLLTSLVTGQNNLHQIVDPFLSEVIDFDKYYANSWWPNGKESGVVLDPRRRFGKPILSESGIPTEAIAICYSVEDSVEMVARIYDVSTIEVERALIFEDKIAA